MMLLLAVAVGTSVRDYFKPYKDKCFLRNRDFARWFWPEKAYGAELVCLQSDWHKYFYTSPQGNDRAEGDDLASIFFCNQRIYGNAPPRPASRRPARTHHRRPTRCTACG